MTASETRARVLELVPLILDLWSLGHSASDIARRLELPSHKHVSKVVGKARSIGDPRAVIHQYDGGRLIGRPGRGGQISRRHTDRAMGMEIVPIITPRRVHD